MGAKGGRKLWVLQEGGGRRELKGWRGETMMGVGAGKGGSSVQSFC